MLTQYKDEQPIVYKILTNTINNNKYSHAYLFETNGYYKSIPLVFSFIKMLFCPRSSKKEKLCSQCHICEMIDNNNFPEIKIIKPDGLWIKKDQLMELQEEFNKKAVIGNKKIYIILEAEKLNKSSANSILKFLEEPEENIIAILVTENIYQMLETIVSRCQVISLNQKKMKYGKNSTMDKLNVYLNDDKPIEEDKKNKIEKIINFPKYYEKYHLDTIININKVWHEYVKSKDEYYEAFDILIIYYKDVLNYLLNKNIEFFDDYVEDIKEIANKNNVDSICNKLKILLEYKEKIKFNVNSNLLMDKLIITLEREK